MAQKTLRPLTTASLLPKGVVTFQVALVLGSGYVRWVGTLRVDSIAQVEDYTTGASVIANIYRNCPSGTVNPRGSYTVSGYALNRQTGTNNTWVTPGSSISLS